MSILFFDTSALAKRYMPETGTRWVRKQTAKSTGNDVVIAQITPVELYSAMSRQYHDCQIDLPRLQAFRKLMMSHIQKQYLMLSLSNAIVAQAQELHESYRLRAYDSVQLASALELNGRLTSNKQELTFITSDIRLLEAARSAGLAIDSPDKYT